MSVKENIIRGEMLFIKMSINSSYGVSSSEQQYLAKIDKYHQLKKELDKEIKRELREKKLNRILYEC